MEQYEEHFEIITENVTSFDWLLKDIIETVESDDICMYAPSLIVAYMKASASLKGFRFKEADAKYKDKLFKIFKNSCDEFYKLKIIDVKMIKLMSDFIK